MSDNASHRPRSRLGPAGWATLFALGLSVLTLTLTLLGYGYDLAYLGEFGLTPELLQRTPSDFLLRSYLPLLHRLDALSGIWTAEAFSRFMRELGAGIMRWYVLVPLCLLVPVMVYFHENWRSSVKPFLDRCWYSRPVWDTRRAIAKVMPRKSTLAGYGGWLLVPSLLAGSGALVYFIVGVLLSAAFFVVAIVPSIGAAPGKSDANALVKHVNGCESSNVRTAPCVRVMRGDEEMARGRLITINGERAFLFPLESDPQQRRYVDVSLSRSRLEVLGK